MVTNSANSSIRSTNTIKTLYKNAKKPGSNSTASKQYQLKKYAEATLGPLYLRAAVQLPQGEDLNEWLAMNTVDFFNQVNLLYGTMSEFCTKNTCPLMSAGTKYTYNWADESTNNQPIPVSAPEYVDKLMAWIQIQLDDEKLFPTKTGTLLNIYLLFIYIRLGISFGKNFLPTVKTIFKRLYRVYAHLYHHHFDHVIVLGQEVHLNTSFKHFIFLVQEFDLIPDQKELAPMLDLIATFDQREPQPSSSS
ncbi:maintenance of ploidy protein mob1 [Neoconidiobolus thromboides FSU 785]|nr:maintenance of ploidy protein mob1 [Neoconidiobolus thromboides FSU 785]